MNRLTTTLTMLALMGTLMASAADADKPWISLFDGSTLDGWTSNGFSEFEAKDGTIFCEGYGASSIVYTGKVNDGVFTDFELRASVFVGTEINSGIIFHVGNKEDPGFDSYEAQINNTYDNENKTGSLFGPSGALVVVKKDPVPSGKWFSYHISVRGKSIVLKVDGKITASYTRPDGGAATKGTFAFQGPNGVVKLKNISVRPL
ncbi:MAG: hypothetical protein ACI8W8_005088 [Rhodothermales bacterium]|jgi:hypothetical protein